MMMFLKIISESLLNNSALGISEITITMDWNITDEFDL